MSFSGIGDSLGYEQITGLSTAKGLTLPASSSNLKFCQIQAESQAVRYRDDGTSPTATVGMMLAVGQLLEYDASNVKALKFIEQAASAKLNVTYYGSK